MHSLRDHNRHHYILLFRGEGVAVYSCAFCGHKYYIYKQRTVYPF
jgi:hypothetical protein